MQKRTSFIGRFTLLLVILLNAALQCGAAARGFGTLSENRRARSEGPNRSGTYSSRLPLWAGWDLESDPAAAAQLLAQNQQPPAPAPDQAQPSGEEKLDLDDQVIRDVFGPLQRGMEGHNLYQVLAIFDQQGTPDYAQVRDQLRAFFDQYDAIRFRYQLLQVTSDKNHGSAVAEIEMDATPADPTLLTLRRDIQMRFHLDLGRKGWKLVGFSPADFFAQ
jgi:hypothetical protein